MWGSTLEKKFFVWFDPTMTGVELHMSDKQIVKHVEQRTDLNLWMVLVLLAEELRRTL